MKIAVYTIAKNETKNVEQFMNTCKGADYVLVGVDVTSTDDTEFKLRKNGAKIIPLNIKPWRFDVARNTVLDALPEDIDVCVAIDLDEILTPNWRQVIEEEWENNLTMLQYPYIYLWKDDQQTIPSLTCAGYKIHDRHAYRWQHAVHENIIISGNKAEKIKFTDKLMVHHHPDLSKPRKYNKILDDVIENDPDNWWMRHIRAREYYNHQEFQKCIDDAKYCLKITDEYSTNLSINQVRSEMCRLIGKSLFNLQSGEIGEIQLWMMRAVSEGPNQRENWVYLAEAWEMIDQYPNAFAAYTTAFQLNDRGQSPECEERCWNNDYVVERIQLCWKKLNEQS
jgi:hypothetical protein